MGISILSTIARLSGGTFDTLPKQYQQWTNAGRQFRKDKEDIFVQQYLSPMLLCGKPSGIDTVRWLSKCLSNDQTAFTGFTSLVDVSQTSIGYDGPVTLLPKASFVEPFFLQLLDNNQQQQLLGLNETLRSLDSTQIGEINGVLEQVSSFATLPNNRKKGKSPIFFYGIADKPFFLPQEIYLRMRSATSLICEAMTEASNRFKGSLEDALFTPSSLPSQRQFFTGSIDFMIIGDSIYIIDLGVPGVGYIADLLYAAEGLGRKPEFGFDQLVDACSGQVTIYSGKSGELGFFELEKRMLVQELTKRGIDTLILPGDTYEVAIKNKKYPTSIFDYLTRNQPLRNQILGAIQNSLIPLKVYIPCGESIIPETGDAIRLYERTKISAEDYGLIVKKKVLFKEYETGSDYFKPLVTPLWGSEMRKELKRRTLFEQFVPSLLDVDVRGDQPGKRSFEIRMYFCAGEQ